MKRDEAKRVVLLGRSSSGKSSVIFNLRDKGYQVGHEIPTIVLDSRKTRNLDSGEWEKRQLLIYSIQKTLEDSYEGLIFQDRCLMDSYAYSIVLCGQLPKGFDNSIDFSKRYSQVFELENLPFQKTVTRIEEDETQAQKIYDNVRNFYISQGYTPIKVPAFNLEKNEAINQRANFILSKLEELSND